MHKNYYQLVSALSPHDAVSNYTRQIDALLRERGLNSKIFVNHLSPQLQSEHIRPLQEFSTYLNQSDSHLIYQYSVHDAASEYFIRAQGHKTFIYHNITPYHFFRGYNEPIAEICQRGRQMLPDLAKSSDQAIAISNYSRQELIDHGFHPDKVETIPFLFDSDFFDCNQNSPKPTSSTKNLIFVGKIAPHKKIEDVIRAFFLYQKHYQSNSKLHLVGALGMDRYQDELTGLVKDLCLSDSVIFHGRVADSKLQKLYFAADLFITMSEHEGFCVPLIEAMAAQVPILAYASSAIPDTLGDSAIQVIQKDPGLLAETINLIISDQSLSQHIIESQLKRLKQFSPPQIKSRIEEKLITV